MTVFKIIFENVFKIVDENHYFGKHLRNRLQRMEMMNQK